MRKLLLFVLALSLGVAAMAQVSVVKQSALANTVKKAKTVQVDPKPYLQAGNVYVNTQRGVDNVIGTTWYDLQSNSTMAQRIWVHADGTIGATWTRGAETGVPNFPERGTGYNYFDGSSWGPDPSARIEDTRVGWPSYAPYGADGEIVCAHTGGNDGLMFSWREHKGTGDWQHFTLAGPSEEPDLLWPRMITSGEDHQTIQVIACVGSGVEYDGLTMALVYSRSDDGGQTWDPENMILPGMTSDDNFGFGGDDYAWAIPHGDTIAFVVFGGVRDGFAMKSFDNGDTWEKVTFYNSPFPFYSGNEGDMPQCGGGDGFNAIAIDDEGLVHVAFGRQVHVDDVPDDDNWSFFPYSDGLIYWNETMAPLDTTQIGNEIMFSNIDSTTLYKQGQLAAWVQPHDNDTIVGVAYYYSSLVSMPQLAVTTDADGNKIVTFFYSGLAVGFSNAELGQNYRHIWTRKTELDGQGVYGDFEDLTGDVLHLFSECVYPSMFPANNTFHILYETDNLPGNSIQPTGGNHAPVNNNMVYMPITPYPVGINNPGSVAFDVMQNMPNPATGNTMIVVKTQQASAINLTISNMLGQQVYTTQKMANAAGAYTFNVNVSDFNTGVYFYTVTVGDKSVSKKMIVR